MTGNPSARPDDPSDPDCRRCREAVSALLDGEGLPQDEFVARTHLTGCPSCGAAAERASVITRMVRALDERPSPDLLPAILAAWSGSPVTVDDRVSGDDTAAGGPEPPARAGGHPTLIVVGTSARGCAAGCSCGCQDGNPCRCRPLAA